MNAFPSKSLFDNRKSAIQNQKLVGIVALVVTFAFGGPVAEAQQPTKVPRIGFLFIPPSSANNRPASRHFGKGSANWAMSRVKTF
jgi:hypothetical protein